ncbi:hypothetical protein P8452_61416 [Trifolium repens]|nr:hypothetical protein P8452_61416 [Trifolium repens]
MSRQGGGENAITPSGDVQSGGSSKAANLRPFWIAGALMFGVGFVILIVLICKLKSNLLETNSERHSENVTVM